MSTLTRRRLLQLGSLSATATVMPSWLSVDDHNIPAFGLCGSWKDGASAKSAGCTYIEESVGKFLMPLRSEEEFAKEVANGTPELPVPCLNIFLPGELKITGNHPRYDDIVRYAAIAFRRAEKMNTRIIVFGSAGARSIPENFDRETAKGQFISICKSLAPMAAKHQVTLAVEALQKSETNFINKLAEAAEIVEAVHHPNLKMICDIYHALREDDPPEEIVRYKEHLVHCHIAEKESRTAPGVRGDNFRPYFRALKKINYQGRVSLECRWANIDLELPNAVKTLATQYAEA